MFSGSLALRAAQSSLRLTARQLRSSVSRAKREEEDESHQVRERLERNILRAGLRLLRGERAALEENVRQRAVSVDLDKLYELQSEYTELSRQIESLRQQRNINIHKQTTEVSDGAEVALEFIDRGRQLKHDITQLEHHKSHLEQEMFPHLSLLPNTSHPLTPVGGYESVRVVHTHGKKPEFDFPVRSHVEIAESLGLIDFSSAAEASGRRFYYLTRAAALLELALVQYALHKAYSKGFSPVITPDIVRTGVVEGCGFHPRGEATQVYALDRHHGYLSLSGTAEVPLAGGAGQAVRGLYRVHQFSKVELFAVTDSGEGVEVGGGGDVLWEMIALQEEICAELGFHYRLLEMPTGELGSPAHRKFDLEVWMPGRMEYGEVTSASDCTSYQSQRLGIGTRCHGKRSYAHTLNATACAVPRTIIAILENNQTKDGSVAVPAVLHPYLPPDCHHIT